MKKIFKILALSLAGIAVILAAKFSITPTLMKNANYGLSRIINEKSVDNLFIGSSMFRQGVDSSQIIKNESSYNLCYNGNQPWQEYLQIKELLDNNVKIGRIYFDMYIGTVVQDVSVSDVRILQGASVKYYVDTYKELSKNGKTDFNDTYNFFISANNETFITYPISSLFINKRYNRGNAVGNTAGLTAEQLENIDVGLIDSDKTLNKKQMDYLSLTIELCKKNNIDLVFVETPKYVGFYSDGCYSKLMKEYIDFVLKNNCRIICLNQTCDASYNPNITNYEYDNANPGYYCDLIHLSSEGRNEFSQRISEIIEDAGDIVTGS